MSHRGTSVPLPPPARDQISTFVTNGAKTDYDTLTDLERGKAHVAMALLSQETGKAAFDGQFQSLDPQNARPPVVTLSDQEAATREITLTLDEFGRLASLDYNTSFVDTQANAVMADRNTTQNSPPPARPSPLNSASSPTPTPSASASSPTSTDPGKQKEARSPLRAEPIKEWR